VSNEFLLTSAKGCLDSDGDLVPNSIDIDDDNDGVLDQVECPTPTPLTSYTWTRVSGSEYKIVGPTGSHLATVTVRPVSNLSASIESVTATDNTVTGIMSDLANTNAANRRLELKFVPGPGIAGLDLKVLVKEGGNGSWYFHPRVLKLNGGNAGNGVVSGIAQPKYLKEAYSIGTTITPTSTITTKFTTPLAPSVNKNFIDVKFEQLATLANPMVVTYNWNALTGSMANENWSFQILQIALRNSLGIIG
jgi:hypothetical protein